MINGTWFDPHTGEYSKPKRQKVTQWPSYTKPDTPHFQILVVQMEGE